MEKMNKKKIVSKSKNSGLLGKTFTGKALAIINNGQISQFVHKLILFMF